MKKPFREVVGEIFNDPFDSVLFAWLPLGGAGVGFVSGLVLGFLNAGIGGAIVYSIVGLLVGGIIGFMLAIGLSLVILTIPFAVLILVVAAIGWVIWKLWGVGKP